MMMIATCGSNIKPLEHIIQKTKPEQILLLTYQSTETEFLEKQVANVVPDCEVFIEIIRIPENPDEEWWYSLHNEIQEMISKRNPILDADVWLNGGTPWLSHTLHHASILLGLDVNVATIQKIEGQETLFFNFTNPLKTQKLATQLNSLHGPRTRILELLKMHGALTVSELSEFVGSKNEAMRFMLEGRKNRSNSGEELAYKGLRYAGLVEHAEDRQTGKKGRPTFRYKITQLGVQTLSNLDLQFV
jgi:hypothetical protein